MWFLGSSQGTCPIFLHRLVQELCGHLASYRQFFWRTWQLIHRLTILERTSPKSPGRWSLTMCGATPLRFVVCVDKLSDHKVLRVRNVYLKALDDFLVLLSLQTTVTKWLGLNLLLHCCSYHRRADLMPIRLAGGILSRLLLCVPAACHSLQKSRSLHVCGVTVVKLLSRERKSGFFKTLVMTGR